MKIILKESVKNLGVAGDIVDVKRGYMRNFLSPRGYAVPANESNLSDLDGMLEAVRAKNEAKKAAATSIALQLEGKALFFILSASEEGRLFGSVSPRSIIEECQKLYGIAIPVECINMESKIKVVGMHTVDVVLHGEVTAHLIVGVATSAVGIEKLKKEYYGVTEPKEEAYRDELEEWDATKPKESASPYSSEYVEDDPEFADTEELDE